MTLIPALTPSNDNAALSLGCAAPCEASRLKLFHGDALAVLKTLPDNSLDSCVTDPPYGIGFMKKSWDHPENIAFNVELWTEVLRVLKPGAFLLAFSAPRTYHRMVTAIEDAGFEVRDQIAWLYGTGMPKSHNFAKHIDRKLGAAEWEGWGTALKPAMEPIVVARKPFDTKPTKSGKPSESRLSVAENVLKHGVGGMNIDACRIGAEGATTRSHQAAYDKTADGKEDRTHWARTGHDVVELAKGRWPANVIHDGSDVVVDCFPETKPARRSKAVKPMKRTDNAVYGRGLGTHSPANSHEDDGGCAARFFYCAKPAKREKGGTGHVTVKPVELMKYLLRLVTPPGGTVLDPFAGSGTTGVAALADGFVPVLIERDAEYIADIERRTGLKAA